MKNKILSIFAVAPLLMACGPKGVPAKGYAKWKEDIKKTLSGEYKYKSCSYAYLKSVPEQPTLNETCYYYSEFDLNGVAMYSYYAYKDSTGQIVYDMTKGSEGAIYYSVVALIATDSSLGTLGTL